MKILELQTPDDFYKVLKRYIKINNLSYEELAFQIGISEQSLSYYLNRKRKMHFDTAVKLLQALNFDEFVLFLEAPKATTTQDK